MNSDGFLSFEEIKVGYCDHMGKVMTDEELKEVEALEVFEKGKQASEAEFAPTEAVAE